jgi:CheY-like chemotaxis protein
VGQVLIVDDSVETCHMLARLMRRFQHEAECVYGGEPALERLAHSPLPGLVILDYMMPDLDGIEVLRQVRRRPQTSELPIVIYSAVQDDAFQKYAMNMGATEYWTKASTDFSTLQASVERLLSPPPPADPQHA